MPKKSASAPVRRAPARNRPPTSTVRRLPLGSLRVFVAVAEHQSFARAASALGVTNGAVTRQVQSLEGYLGVPVFLRRGQVIALTREGARLLPQIAGSLRDIEIALDEARRARGTGTLKVSMLASFLQQWLLPRLSQFRTLHPDVDLRIHTSVELVRFETSDVQAAIRLGSGQWPLLHAEKLLEEWLVPACAPGLRDRVGVLERPADLERVPLLHSLSEPWSAWTAGNEGSDAWPDSGTSFDDSVAVIRAAEEGQGLALVRWSLAADAIRKGLLVVASRRIVRCERAYYFVCPAEYAELPKLTAFRDWLRQQCSVTATPLGAGARQSETK